MTKLNSMMPVLLVLALLGLTGLLIFRIRSDEQKITYSYQQQLEIKQTQVNLASQHISEAIERENKVGAFNNGRTTIFGTESMRQKEIIRRAQMKQTEQFNKDIQNQMELRNAAKNEGRNLDRLNDSIRYNTALTINEASNTKAEMAAVSTFAASDNIAKGQVQIHRNLNLAAESAMNERNLAQLGAQEAMARGREVIAEQKRDNQKAQNALKQLEEGNAKREEEERNKDLVWGPGDVELHS